MRFELMTASHEAWRDVIIYAEKCSWRAGKFLANEMRDGSFSDWERVIAAFDGDRICGYCTVRKNDCIPDVEYTPYIGYMFVGEEYRGHRLSEKLIDFASGYLKSIGFDRVHIVSDHENLYEKYGFDVIDRKTAPWGSIEKIYMRKL